MVAIVELADEIGERGRRERRRPQPRRHGHVRLGLGEARPGLAHLDHAERARAHTPAGLLIHFGGTLVYHLGDTALFCDLQLIARRGDQVDVALVPIGGHYTMDRYDAVTAVEFIDAGAVIPIHYDTFPPIETDAEAFKADVESSTGAQVVVLDARARRTRCVTHAVVLIEAERAAMPTLGGALADVEGVAEAYCVTGEWDFVAILRVRDPEEVAAGRHRPARAARRASSARTRWSPSRSSPSTTSRRCSPSASDAVARHRAPRRASPAHGPHRLQAALRAVGAPAAMKVIGLVPA